MKIDHIAIRAQNLEKLKEFYSRYFGMTPGEKYTNPAKGFSSYFLSTPDRGARIELISERGPERENGDRDRLYGIAHIAISVGSKTAVDDLTQKLKSGNFNIVSEPRTTGDGYYESVVLDPEGNRIEITA